jgi:hypothetical protein
MSRLIPTSERITRARALILKARELPVAKDFGGFDFSYVANVKDLLQQARDQFISYSPSATPDVKREVAEIFKEIELTEKEILHKPLVS